MLFSAASAGTIRHDDQDFDGDAPDDELYTGLAEQYPSVGWVFNADDGGSTCSWTLIGPHWALTAAHCVDGGTTPSELTYRLGTPDFNTAPAETRGAERIHPHPNWNGNDIFRFTKGWDIALVRLDDDIESIGGSKLNRTVDPLGEIITMVGYGRTGTGQGAGAVEPAGTKRAGRNVVDIRRKEDRILVTDFDSPINSDLSQSGGSSPIYLEYQIAPGDSGGGSFLTVNGEERVAGVNSFYFEGTGLLDFSPEANYGDTSGLNSVSALDHWIDATITQYANETRWVGGSSDDFFDGDNWSQEAIPGPDDTVVFNQDTAYTVEGGTAVVRRMVVRDGDVTYDTEGSVVVADFDPERFSGLNDPSESLIIGVTELDDPTFRVTGGGPFQPWRVRIAEMPGSFGRLEVEGGSNMQGNRITVGVGGDGELGLDNGEITPVELRLGAAEHSTGLLSARNGSHVDTRRLIVGHHGHGELFMNPGTTLKTRETAIVTHHDSADGSRIELDNADWTATGNVVIGDRAFGAVQVRNGSTFDASGRQVYLGNNSVPGLLLGGGSMTVTDPGSQFMAGDWIIGWRDSGFAGVRNDATAEVDRLIVAGNISARNSELDIEHAELTIHSEAYIGFGGEGEVIVDEGGKVDATGVHTIVGHQPGSNGLITIRDPDAGRDWVTNDLTVGNEGVGQVIIEDGGRMDVNGITRIAKQDTAVSSGILVRGEDSLLEAGPIYVGDATFGGLAVEDGGTVDSSSSVHVGWQALSIGQLTVDDATLMGGSSTFGNQGSAFVTFKNQAQVELGGIRVGDAAGGYGRVDIESGADVHFQYGLTLGNATESSGEVHVTGYAATDAGLVPTMFKVGGGLDAARIGDEGDGEMTVTNGAWVEIDGGLTLGVQSDGQGELTIGGAVGFGENLMPATVVVNRDLKIGEDGQGTVTLQPGGRLDVRRRTTVGDVGDGGGRLIMDGGTLETGYFTVIPDETLQFRTDFKDGLIHVTGTPNGGSFDHQGGDFHIDGTLTGGVAEFEMSNDVLGALGGNDMVVGNGNEGGLLVRDESHLTSDDTTIGWTDDAIGRVTVRDAILIQTGDLVAGRMGQAQVTAETGGLVAVDGDATLGRYAGSQGQMTVTGFSTPDLTTRQSTRFEITGEASGADGDLIVGKMGDGLLNIHNGATVDVAGDVDLAIGDDTAGVINVSGTVEGLLQDLHARLNVGGDLNLSQQFDDSSGLISLPVPSGSAALYIADGGIVNVEGDTRLGTLASDDAVVNIQGGSLRTTSLNTSLGELIFDHGEIHIEGGALNGLNGNDVIIGDRFAGGSSLLRIVDGGQFHLDNIQRNSDGVVTDPGDGLVIGGGTRGEMQILSGSSVVSASGVIGAIVDPGLPGGDALAASNVTGDAILGPPFGPNYGGDVLVQGEGSEWVVGDGLQLGSLFGGSTDSSFNSTGRLTIRSGARVTATGGVIVNPGSELVIDGGELDADVIVLNPLLADNDLDPAKFQASGSFQGDFANLGLLEIGSSPGELLIDGDYAQVGVVGDQTLEGILSIEIGGLIPGTQFDLLEITGDAQLGGLLRVSLLDQFAPAKGDRFAFLKAGSLTGEFFDLELPELPAYQQWELIYSDEQVSLLVVPEPGTAGLLLLSMAALLRRRS